MHFGMKSTLKSNHASKQINKKIKKIYINNKLKRETFFYLDIREKIYILCRSNHIKIFHLQVVHESIIIDSLSFFLSYSFFKTINYAIVFILKNKNN